MSWLKRHLPKKRWKRVCLYIVSTFIILVAADMILVQCWRHIDISPETTRITAPLKADGLPDYVAVRNAEYSQGVTAENNAAPELFKIIGTERFSKTWREQVLPQLGMSPESTPKTFVNYDIWLRTHTPTTLPAGVSDAEQYRDDEWDATIKRPWTGEHPDRLAWLNAQQGALVRLHVALEKDRFYAPWYSASPGDVMSDLSWLGEARSCSMLLAADAMRAAGDADARTFQRDVIDASKLARLVAQGSSLIEYLESMAIDLDASRAVQQGAKEPRFPQAKDARQLLQAWTQIPVLPDESRVWDTGERFLSLNVWCESSRIGLQTAMGGPPPSKPILSPFFPIHYNAILRTFNHYFDELVAANQMPTYKRRAEAMKMIENEWASNHNFWDIGADLVKILIPSVGLTIKIYEITFVNRDLATLALALRVYREEHGAFPESLAALSPGILPVVPVDGFTGAAFHYRREGKAGGGYVVYSVGPDGKDDGGRDRKEAKNGEGWDIVVRAAE